MDQLGGQIRSSVGTNWAASLNYSAINEGEEREDYRGPGEKTRGSEIAQKARRVEDTGDGKNMVQMKMTTWETEW